MKQRFLVYASALVFGAVMVTVLATRGGLREPTHAGRPLSEWIQEVTEGPEEERQRAIDAMLAMESELYPWLTRMLSARDSRLKKWWFLSRVRRGWLGGRFQPRMALDEQYRALLVFHVLGPASVAAVPSLEKLLNDPHHTWVAGDALLSVRRDTVPVFARALTNQSVSVQATAATSLGSLGAEARSALPRLVECLVSATDMAVRADAAASIGAIAGEFSAEEQRRAFTNELAALIVCLDDPDAPVRAAAAKGLRAFGTNARPAVPKLRELLHRDADADVRKWAELALMNSGEWRLEKDGEAARFRDTRP